MNNVLKGPTTTALNLASEAAQGMRNGVGNALQAIGTGISLVGLRDTSRAVVKAARRNPATAAVAVTAAVGAGVALWALRKARSKAAHNGAGPIEVEPIRVERKPARRAPRKSAARKTATTTNSAAATH